MRLATAADLNTLVALMVDFYAEAGYELNRPAAAQVFATLLNDARLGYIWLLETPDGHVAGHLVLTMCFSMEYGGMKGFLDDLFVLPSYRNMGLATTALHTLRAFCESHDIRAVSVEVDPENTPAQRVYRRIGFNEMPGRQLLTLPLAAIL